MRRFWTGLAAVLVAGSLGFRADDRDEVGKATKKSAEAASYTFKVTLELEGGPMGNNGPIEFTGAHNKDSATHIKGELMGQEFEAYKKGEKIVTKQNGEWQRGRGRGGMGMMSRAVRAPHEELKEFEKRFKEIKKGDKKSIDGKDCTPYHGPLSEDGVKDLLPMGRMGDAELSGDAKLWIDGEGIIRRYEVNVSLSMTFQGNAIDMKISRTIDLTAIGETKVELPREVQDLFNQKEEEKSNP